MKVRSLSDAVIDYQAVTVKCEVNFEKHFIFRIINAAKRPSSHHHLLPVDDIYSAVSWLQGVEATA